MMSSASAPSDSRLPRASEATAPPSAPVRVAVSRPLAVVFTCGLLCIAVALVFGKTLSYDFVNFDDTYYVAENWHVQKGLTLAQVGWAITARHASNWHPLTWLSHMLDCQLYGLKSGGHHLTSVLLHAAAAILLLLAWHRMTGALWPSAWVAAVFAIHPLRVESVAWVAERKDVLSGLCFMLTLWFYADFVRRPASWKRYLAVVVSFALGLTAKPMLVTLPLVLLLLDYWPLERGSRGWVALVVEKVPLCVLAAASCAITLAVQRDAMQTLDQLDFFSRLANATVACIAYLGKMLCPAGLTVCYPLPPGSWPAWKVGALAMLLLAVSAAAFAARRRRPYLLCGWLWYLGTLVPVIGLVQVGNQALADRYTYLTQVGLYAALAWGARDMVASRPSRRRALAAVSVLVLAALMVRAWQQTLYWRNSERLWRHALACSSNNVTAHTNLGLALLDGGKADEAIEQFQKALEIKPDDYYTHNGLGQALAERGQTKKAIDHFRKAVEVLSCYAPAHNRLGQALAGEGQVDEAMVHFQKALEVNPDYPEAHNNLGLMFIARRQVDEAILHFRKAVEIRPNYAPAHSNLGTALAGRGQIDVAITHYRKALEILPDYVPTRLLLAKTMAGCGRIDEAIGQYRKVLEIAPDSVRRATSILALPWRTGANSARRSTITARSWKSRPAAPRPATTWEPPWPPSARWTRP